MAVLKIGPGIVHLGFDQNRSKTRQNHEVQRPFFLLDFHEVLTKNDGIPGAERVVLAGPSKSVNFSQNGIKSPKKGNLASLFGPETVELMSENG